ncbi:MAG: hypothetical protein K2Y21_08940 [Phycisphaerales bacterium]|nr:hypothetical protein [Phycisphaerales bacterium]
MQSKNEKPYDANATSANNDPISGAKGAHPIGVGVGAVGVGAAAGAVAGAVAGPIGAVAGAVGGAVIGGLVGKEAAEAINPTTETEYWRTRHSSQPYAQSPNSYADYAPAYQYGWESYRTRRPEHTTFEQAETDLARGWQDAKGRSNLHWAQVRAATRDAWNRVHNGSTRA